MAPFRTEATGNADCPWDEFDPDWYVDRNYRAVRSDDRQILGMVRDFFATTAGPVARHGIDVGPGANLYPSLTMLPLCDEIVLWERSSSNVAWLEREVADYSPSWDAYWQVLTERRPYRKIAEPRAALRHKATVTCRDLFELGEERWDVGTMFFVAESITARKEEFHRAVERFIRSLRPGAPFAAAFMQNSTGYMVGPHRFPAVAVSEQDVKSCLTELNCSVAELCNVPVVSPLRDGYTGMVLALGMAGGPDLKDAGAQRRKPRKRLGSGSMTANQRPRAAPAHLSIELGHLYSGALSAADDRIREHFRSVAPWAAAAIQAHPAGATATRVSTCFLIDDYFADAGSPAQVVPALLRGAREHGLEIDYLARESGCVEARGAPLARLVAERLAPVPVPESSNRPSVDATGWLSNGQRSGNAVTRSDESTGAWRPPSESGPYRHSIFVDVELWDDRPETRTWSCAFLAAVWQLLRLGLLQHKGAAATVPMPWTGALPNRWSDLPAIIQLRPDAAAFHAFRTLSIIPGQYLPIEHAARTVLSQVSVDATARHEIAAQARDEGISMPDKAIDRIGYVFVG